VRASSPWLARRWALGLDWVLYERVLPFTGALGFWVSWYVIFLLFYAAMAGLQWSRLVVRDRVMAVALGQAAASRHSCAYSTGCTR
jgi:phosphate transport system permease protein